jgi:hypothetical protein
MTAPIRPSPPLTGLSNRPAAPSVTVCAVDTRTPVLALRALAISLRAMDFGPALLLTDRPVAADELPPSERGWVASVEQRVIPSLPSAQAYSQFVLRELVHHIETPHVLLIQWDGFVWQAQAWQDAFLNFDYIGAPWRKAPVGLEVGNGGFCLRSKALMQAVSGLPDWHHPEDVCIAQTHRHTLEQGFQVQFAPASLARQFAFENESPPGACFGFHGMRNLHRVLGPEAAAGWFEQLPLALFAGRDAFKTARDLLHDGHVGLARQVLQRRWAAGARDWKTRLLGWRLALGV